MAGSYKLRADGKDMIRFLTSTVGSFIQDRLINKEQRIQHKEQCAERLAAEDGSNKNLEVRYSDQAVLANLDWGIDALEEAINTSNMETKLARLDYAEKMLQVCAMLNSQQKTAGVPNFYLSAWAHLTLAYLWKLRNNVRNSVLHVLEMFIIDPFFARIDFAPELWQSLFLPHMSSIVGWYAEERQRIVMEVIPDSTDLSLTVDFDQFFNESLIFSMRPDQVEKMQKLEKVYGEALDENTRLYAKYYKEYMNFDPTINKKGMPMLPIAEPPMTPLHEFNQSIPNYVKFGPILPKSAGFSSSLKDNQDECRPSATSDGAPELEEFAEHAFNEELVEENEFASNYGEVDVYSEVKAHKLVNLNSMRTKEDVVSISKGLLIRKDRSYSPSVFSPLDSPGTPSSKLSSPKPGISCRDPEPILRLLSNRMTDPTISLSLPVSPRLCNDTEFNFADSDGEVLEVQKNCRRNGSYARSVSFGKIKTKASENSFLSESEDELSQSNISLPSSEKVTPRTRPPKDFVCPITSQLFSDPVTLETGQTYERRAIQEWLKRGNTTCPITRQALSAVALPKTNYVLKRLITSWKEQYPDLAQELSFSETPRSSRSPVSSKERTLESTPSPFDLPLKCTSGPIKTDKHSKRFLRAAVSTSPTSVISQAAVETVINGLKPYTSCLCTSEDLQECEAAVLTIARIWRDSKADPGVHAYLAKPTILNGFIEILSASLNREVLSVSIYILSELLYHDEAIGEILTSVDSDFDCLAALLKNGLAEAAVLIYQLRPESTQLSAHGLIPSLLQVIANKNEELDFRLVIEPRDAAIAMLEQILIGGDENSRTVNALNVISSNGLPVLIKCLERNEGRLSVVSLLLSCMRADKSCRNLIASRADLAPIIELFHAGNDIAKRICVDFISELIRLNRRTFCYRILQIIKDEGKFSTMHTFLTYLQMAPMEQQPVVASLLLQLDLLVEPLKMSIYREEAIETLIEALRKKDFPVCQTIALDALASLPGHLSTSGKPLTEAWLLQIAGLDQSYSNLRNADRLQRREDDSLETVEDEEEKVADAWGKRVAFVLCNHENGSIFKALEDCFKSNSLEMAKSCLVVATWLIHMLSDLPDTGVRAIARQCLFDQFMNVLQSSRNLEEKMLASLALKSFINDPEAHQELVIHAKSICKSLRKLKKCSVVVADTMKTLMTLPSINVTELWSCSEAVEIDSSSNADVLALIHVKGRVFSSHSDGQIKVWDSGKRSLRLIQEVRNHTKAVTCLFISSSGDKMYSGSLDKTIRVWAIEQEEIHCLQVHDMKDAVHSLAANTELACFASQGTGAKVSRWSGAPKHINFSRTVKCVAMTEENLYCGCTGYSIQEVDLKKGSSCVFYSGTRKLLGKQTIHALCIHDGLLFSGGSSVDGIAGKVFSLSTKAVVGSISTGFDIHCMAVNNDYIFTGTKCGIIEVWLRDRLTRVASIKVCRGGNVKVTSLAFDSVGEMLFAGTSDGKIQGWILD